MGESVLRGKESENARPISAVLKIMVFLGAALLFVLLAPGARAEGILAGTVSGGGSELKYSPSAGSGNVIDVPEGSKVLLSSFSMGWYEAVFSGETGYIKASAIVPSTEGEGDFGYGLIADSGVRMRKDADEASKSLMTLRQGAYVRVTGVRGGWYKIYYNRKTGYVRADLLNIDAKPAAIYSAASSEEKARHIVETAKTYIGVRYVYGGTTPGRGFDCSGFTQYVFARCGYTLDYRTSQYKNGSKAAYSELQPGDLVFFDTNRNKTIGHVGIYIGDGKFIHSPRPGKSVQISSMEKGSYYYKIFVTARRVV